MTSEPMPAPAPDNLARGYRSLQRITAAIRSQVDLGRVLDTLVGDTGHLLDLSLCALARWDPAGGALVFSQEFRRDTPSGPTPSMIGRRLTPGADPARRQLDHRLFKEQRSLVRPCTGEADGTAIVDDLQGLAHVVTPVVAEQRIVGILVSARVRELGAWRDDEVEFLRAAADSTAVAIQHASVRGRLRLLSTAAARLNSTMELDAFLRHLVEAAMRATQARTAMAGVREGDRMVCRELCRDGIWEPAEVRFSKDQGLAGWSWANRAPCISHDAPNDPRGDAGIVRQLGIDSVLCVPIVRCDGEVLGFLELINKSAGAPFAEEDVQFTATLAHHAALALELRKS